MSRVAAGPAREHPFAPGESPFQVKGTLWLGFTAYVNEHVPGGCTELARGFDPQMRSFFEQLFVASGWYDILPMVPISGALAQLRGLAHVEQNRQTATWHGQRDLKGIYKTLLGQTSPAALCKRFTSIYSQLYNFGRVELLREEEKRVEACGYGMPELLVEWWKAATEFYMRPIIAAAGAKNPRWIWRGLPPDGQQHGLRCVRTPSFTVWD